jgi:hypothetical protein
MVERPPRRAASSGRSEPSSGLGPFRRPLAALGTRSKAVSEALRTVARAWAGAGEVERQGPSLEGDRGRAGSAPPGAGQPALAHRGRWIGFGVSKGFHPIASRDG